MGFCDEVLRWTGVGWLARAPLKQSRLARGVRGTGGEPVGVTVGGGGEIALWGVRLRVFGPVIERLEVMSY